MSSNKNGKMSANNSTKRYLFLCCCIIAYLSENSPKKLSLDRIKVTPNGPLISGLCVLHRGSLK